MAFWEAVSAAKDRSTARIASRIIAVWDVTTYVGIDKHKKLQGRRAVEDRIVRRRDILSEYRNTAVDLSPLASGAKSKRMAALDPGSDGQF